MVFDRPTWIGFMITAFGWTLLLSAPQAMEHFASLTGRSGVYLNMPAIAQCAILTGLGLAIVGAVQTGFGALNAFFEALLERTGKMRSKSFRTCPTAKKIIVERGRVKDRAYVLYIDGTVEVETMLGRRIFSSLRDAQEFIA
jgi:hypothetical protein